jgi:hypothetical protein
MRAPGEITFMCLIMFFVVSIDPKDPIWWHNTIKALAGLSCGIMALITKIRVVSGKKHLISGRSGNLMDVV